MKKHFVEMNLTEHEMRFSNFWGGKEGGLAPGRSRWLRHRKKSYLMVMASPSPWHGHQSLIGRWLRHRPSQVCYNAITPRWWIVFHHAIARWLFWAWSLFYHFDFKVHYLEKLLRSMRLCLLCFWHATVPYDGNDMVRCDITIAQEIFVLWSSYNEKYCFFQKCSYLLSWTDKRFAPSFVCSAMYIRVEMVFVKFR